MAKGKNYCCCTLRTVCLIFAALIFIWSLVIIMREAVKFIGGTYYNAEISTDDIEILAKRSKVRVEQIQSFILTSKFETAINLTISVVNVVVSFVFILGVKKRNSKHLIPMLVSIPMEVILSFVLIVTFICCSSSISAALALAKTSNKGFYVFIVVHTISSGLFHPITVTLNVVYCFSIIISFFIWLCFFIHWQEIRAKETNGKYRMQLKLH